MTHWSAKYLGGAWSPECDCFGWFRIIQEAEFGRSLADMERGGCNLTLFAANVMRGDVPVRYGWRQADAPKEGDAAFLTKSKAPHHIGVVTFVDEKFHVVHAPEWRGVMVSDLQSLRLDLWRVVSYWTPVYAD